MRVFRGSEFSVQERENDSLPLSPTLVGFCVSQEKGKEIVTCQLIDKI